MGRSAESPPCRRSRSSLLLAPARPLEVAPVDCGEAVKQGSPCFVFLLAGACHSQPWATGAARGWHRCMLLGLEIFTVGYSQSGPPQCSGTEKIQLVRQRRSSE